MLAFRTHSGDRPVLVESSTDNCAQQRVVARRSNDQGIYMDIIHYLYMSFNTSS